MLQYYLLFVFLVSKLYFRYYINYLVVSTWQTTERPECNAFLIFSYLFPMFGVEIIVFPDFLWLPKADISLSSTGQKVEELRHLCYPNILQPCKTL